MKTFWKIIVVLLVFASVTFYFLRQPEDISELSKQVDMKAGSTLLQLGLSDENIRKNLSVERKSNSARWLEFIKEIKTSKDRQEIYDKIKFGLEEYPVTVTLSADKGSILISKGRIVLNRITFFVPQTRIKAAILIDDIGPDDALVDNFLKLGIPLTYCIMPFEKHSRDTAEKLAAAGQIIFLHQPMEPEGFPIVDPGSRALLLRMNEKEIRDMFEKNLSDIPGACGVNNHMGSAFTSNKEKTEYFLKYVKKKNIIFVDSFTSVTSVAYRTALGMDIPALQNECFLDNKDDIKYIIRQLELFKKSVMKNGEGIAIGHIHKKNLPAALEKVIPEFKQAGIELMTVPDYIKTENK